MNKQYFAVFDTNVLVSALMSARQDSPTVRLLDYVIDDRIYCCITAKSSVNTTMCSIVTSSTSVKNAYRQY